MEAIKTDVNLSEIDWNNLNPQKFAEIYSTLVDSSKSVKKSKKIVMVNANIGGIPCLVPEEELEKLKNMTNPNQQQILKNRIIEKYKDNAVAVL